MKQLSPLDSVFLYQETQKTQHHDSFNLAFTLLIQK